MVGWHHRLEGLEFGQAAGIGDGQGSLVCCSLWGHKELDIIEQLIELNWLFHVIYWILHWKWKTECMGTE